jgi:hypothetical protein
MFWFKITTALLNWVIVFLTSWIGILLLSMRVLIPVRSFDVNWLDPGTGF